MMKAAQSGKARSGMPKLTWSVIEWFMLAMVLLDVIGYLIAKYGFDHCYGVLCFI
jgi:hypothetical protein